MKADLGRKNRTGHACVVRLSQIRKVPVEYSVEVWKILALGSLLGICVPSFLLYGKRLAQILPEKAHLEGQELS
jgi:hypothetical protein